MTSGVAVDESCNDMWLEFHSGKVKSRRVITFRVNDKYTVSYFEILFLDFYTSEIYYFIFCCLLLCCFCVAPPFKTKTFPCGCREIRTLSTAPTQNPATVMNAYTFSNASAISLFTLIIVSTLCVCLPYTLY